MRISKLIVCAGYSFFITSLFYWCYLENTFSNQPAIFNQIFFKSFLIWAIPIGVLTTAVLSMAGALRLVFAYEAKGNWQVLKSEIIDFLILTGAILIPILISQNLELINKIGLSLSVLVTLILTSFIYRCYLSLEEIRVIR